MVSNVNRALSLFRDVKSMNIRYLWSVEEIVDGEPDVIWGLLDDIRKVQSSSILIVDYGSFFMRCPVSGV